jgi:hypothetical protein
VRSLRCGEEIISTLNLQVYSKKNLLPSGEARSDLALMKIGFADPGEW